jgi:putative glutathione S-transferase
MGQLVDGVWHDVWYDTKATGGQFVRTVQKFRNFITADGSAGPTGDSGFKAESGRYHLYVSLACPWAHRTLIFRKLKGLEPHISISIVNPTMLSNGWTFEPYEGGAAGDALFGKQFLHEIYTKAAPQFSGRVTVPVLWDKQTNSIVSNESSEIIRMFNSAFNDLTGNQDDYYPAHLADEIDAVNAHVYEAVNNGVYRAGFATTQLAYEAAFNALFETLDILEAKLSTQRYLVGNSLTEADWRLFVTLIRFDAVYVAHFKCNLRRIADYPNLSNYMRELYQWPEIAETVNIVHIKQHYFGSHPTINPTLIVPAGPQLDFTSPHDRARLT